MIGESDDNRSADHQRHELHSPVDHGDSHGEIPSDDVESRSELTNLDELYQQAHDAMEAVASDLDSASNTIDAIEEDPDETESDLQQAEPDESPETFCDKTDSETDSIEEESGDALRPAENFTNPIFPSTSLIENSEPPKTRITPKQIVEAALFVGGTPLTTRKLSSLLNGEFDTNFIAEMIDDLNRQYAEEGRPYEIQFGEGGYRLLLREEFERVRNRIFGFGPKEVKLSQETLEVLALVAYQQPISQNEVEELGKDNAGTILRQLLRRELVTIDRGENRKKDVKYRTTPRFLEVFGLGSLDELPQAEEMSFK